MTLDALMLILIIALKIVAIILGLVVLVLYLTYFERKVIGYMHVRLGPNRVGPADYYSHLPIPSNC